MNELPTIAPIKNQIKQRAAELSRQLNMPPGELLDIVTLAGLEAIRDTLAKRGKVTFPLQLTTAGDIAPPLKARTATPLPPVPGMGSAVMIAPSVPQTLPTP